MISKLLREIEWFEMCTKHMISMHIKISLTIKVFYFKVPKSRYYHVFSENAASNLDYGKILEDLDPSKLDQLVTAYKDELEMFGYHLDLETLQFQVVD